MASQGYLWLSYDLEEVIKLIRVTFKQQKFKKLLYVIPSALFSFLQYYYHSFRITVIPSGLLSFLLYYCHSFRIIVIPSVSLSFLLELKVKNSTILTFKSHLSMSKVNRILLIFFSVKNIIKGYQLLLINIL